MEVPSYLAGSCAPILISKRERRFTGFDNKIVAKYSRSMTMREIQGFLAEQYGNEVNRWLIRSVANAVMAGGHGLAGPATGADAPGGVLRHCARENSRGRGGAQQGYLVGSERAAQWHVRHPGAVDREHRGSYF